jgi:hypothetical protein
VRKRKAPNAEQPSTTGTGWGCRIAADRSLSPAREVGSGAVVVQGGGVVEVTAVFFLHPACFFFLDFSLDIIGCAAGIELHVI